LKGGYALSRSDNGRVAEPRPDQRDDGVFGRL